MDGTQEHNGIEPQKRVYIVAHTHWDREWYQPFPTFRYRLVAMVDELLDRMQNDAAARFPVFHLDGQTSLLRDYLEIRPEREQELRELISAGRILVGPWFVQPDETLVSGEALIRNLQIGIETAEEFGGAMRVGYVPDIFGHIGQLPQILAGFGIDNAFLWRGMPVGGDASGAIQAEQREPGQGPTTEFLWRAPDGTEVLGIYLSTSGYFTAPNIGDEDEMASLLQILRSRAITDELLIMNGADHFHVQPDLPEAVAALQKQLGDYRFEITGMPDYIAAVRQALRIDNSGGTATAYERGASAAADSAPARAAHSQHPSSTAGGGAGSPATAGSTPEQAALSRLRLLHGELRDTRRSPEGLFLLYGTLSSRMPLKQRNFAAERLMERVLEPAAAQLMLTEARAGRSATEQVTPRFGRWLAHMWRRLLENHAHDSICGCSVDQVARDMEQRYEALFATAEALLRDITTEIAREPAKTDGTSHPGGKGRTPPKTDVASTPAAQKVGDPLFVPFLLHNAAGVASGEAAIAELPLPLSTPPQPFYRAAAGAPSPFAITDSRGNTLPCQILSVSDRPTVDYAPRRAPRFRNQPHATVAFLPTEPIAPLGNAWFALTEVADPTDTTNPEEPANVTQPGERTVAGPGHAHAAATAAYDDDGSVTLDNGEASVRIDAHGTLSIRQGTRSIRDLLRFEDDGDIGDLYSYSPPQRNRTVTTHPPGDRPRTTVEVLYSGPIAAGARVEYEIPVPKELRADRRERSDELVRMPIEAIVSLRTGSPVAEIQVSVDNRADNHRLRAVFATGIVAETSLAQSTFCVEERPARAEPVPTQYWREDAPNSHPQKEWCAVQNDQGEGVALFNQGLPEYELLPRSNGAELAVTLFRAVGNVHSRDSLTIDRRDWGIPFHVPDAQLRGRHRYTIGVALFDDGWDRADIDHLGQRFAFGYEAVPISAPSEGTRSFAASLVPDQATSDRAPQAGAPARAGSATPPREEATAVAREHGPALGLASILRSIGTEGIHVSSVKPAAGGGSIVVRLWNNRSRTQSAEVHLDGAVETVALATLAEERVRELPSERVGDETIVRIDAAPWQIITLELTLA